MQSRTKVRGFTLIEIMIGTAVLSIIAMALAGVTELASKSLDTNATIVEAQSRVHRALNKVQRSFRCASLSTLQYLPAGFQTLQAAVEIKLLPPLCPLSVAATDFTQARLLIRRGHAAASRWLREGGLDLPEPQRFLAAHRHGGADLPRAGVGVDES